MDLERKAVLAACRDFLEGKRAGYAAEIAALDEAAAGETKSSAGDKYETAREMIAQSRRLMEKNLSEAEAGLAALDRIAAAPAPVTVAFGALVETSQGWFLVGPSFGEVEMAGGVVVRTLSLASPLGQALRGKAAGATLPWKGGVLEVRRILTWM
jgi:transcription elongation GreA/GreB family factor